MRIGLTVSCCVLILAQMASALCLRPRTDRRRAKRFATALERAIFSLRNREYYCESFAFVFES